MNDVWIINELGTILKLTYNPDGRFPKRTYTDKFGQTYEVLRMLRDDTVLRIDSQGFIDGEFDGFDSEQEILDIIN